MTAANDPRIYSSCNESEAYCADVENRALDEQFAADRPAEHDAPAAAAGEGMLPALLARMEQAIDALCGAMWVHAQGSPNREARAAFAALREHLDRRARPEAWAAGEAEAAMLRAEIKRLMGTEVVCELQAAIARAEKAEQAERVLRGILESSPRPDILMAQRDAAIRERDEARATRDLHKQRQQEEIERANAMERERDEARARLEAVIEDDRTTMRALVKEVNSLLAPQPAAVGVSEAPGCWILLADCAPFFDGEYRVRLASGEERSAERGWKGWGGVDVRDIVSWWAEPRHVVSLVGQMERDSDEMEKLQATLQAGAGGGWIACSERMPESSDRVLVYTDRRRFGCNWAYLSKRTGLRRFLFKPVEGRPTHWQPLPAPPALGGEGGG